VFVVNEQSYLLTKVEGRALIVTLQEIGEHLSVHKFVGTDKLNSN
jgi:hypothetical protein